MLYTNALTFCLVAASAVSAKKTIDYKKAWTSKGDKLPDFSFAGYHQSEIPLPDPNSPATKTINSDQSSAIQSALDEVYKRGGGVVFLKAGTYALSTPLVIQNGTVLRGDGIAKTILTVKDLKQDVITMGKTTQKEKRGSSVDITDKYVPAGTDTVQVSDSSIFKVGMDVYVEREVTQKWIDAMGMRAYKKGGEHDRDFTWLKPGDPVSQPRQIKSVQGKAISFTIPLTDSLNTEGGMMSPKLLAYTPPLQSREMGIEKLSMRVNPSCSGKVLTDKDCKQSAVNFPSWTTDSWARNLDLTGFNNQINVEASASRITITNVTMNRDAPTDNGAGYALDIAVSGSLVLVHDCKSKGAKDARSYNVATQRLVPGPNACIGFEAQQPVQSIEPHARWAHGFLNEGSKVAAVLYRNRAGAGTGHGWTITNGVSWNSNSSSIVMQDPPLGQNYCFGCVGPKSKKRGEESNSTGEYGDFVDPPSLFKKQLKDRGFDFSL